MKRSCKSTGPDGPCRATRVEDAIAEPDGVKSARPGIPSRWLTIVAGGTKLDAILREAARIAGRVAPGRAIVC